MASIPDVFSNNIVTALCGMILHSLWQGILLAVCTGFVLLFTRNKSSAHRYNLLLASLILFSIGAIYTFINGLVHITSYTSTSIAHKGTALPLTTGHTGIPIMQASFMDNIMAYLDAHSFAIVCIWFIIVCLRSLQLLTGMRGVFLLRYKEVTPVSGYWQHKVKNLSAKMGISSAIQIMESGIAKVPMVIGHFKPLILIPLGMLAGLPQEEVETILVHELAHIRRKDYLVNMLQSMVEIVFFFNPAVLWASSLIRKEREHCCDDITVSMANSKTVYIKALVSTQEYAQQQPAYAMALNGEKKHLLSRVKRLAFNDRKPITYMEKSILAACILMAVLCITFFSYGRRKEVPVKRTTTTTVSTVTKQETQTTTPSNEEGIRIYKPSDVGNGTSVKHTNGRQSAYVLKENNVLYQLFVKNGKPDVLFVNAKAIPADKLSGYNGTIQKIMMLYNNEEEAQEISETTTANEAGQQQDTAYTNAISIPVKIDIAIPVKPVIPDRRRPATPVTPANPASPVIADKRRPVIPEMPLTPVNPVKPANPVAPQSNEYKSEDLIADMIRDHIIAGQGSNLSFKLSTNEFVVNGEKQPDPVYSKYKTKYIKGTGHREVTWYYNYDTSDEPH